MVENDTIKLEDDTDAIKTQIYNDNDLLTDPEQSIVIDIDSSDLFTAEELVLEHDFSSVGSFDDLALYLEGIEEKFGVDFPDFSSGARENIIVSTNDTSQVMVFDSDTPTTAIITGGNEIKAGTVSGDVALFITGGNIELDLVGGTTTAFVENLFDNDINLTGSKGDIVLSVLTDEYQEGDYTFKDGKLFRGDDKLSVSFEDIENFEGNFIINDVQSNTVTVLIEGEQKAFGGMEEGLRDFFIVSDDESDVFVDDNVEYSNNHGIILEVDETFNEMDFGELGNEIFANDEIMIDSTDLASLNVSNSGLETLVSDGNSSANSLSATEELLAEDENAENQPDSKTEVNIKLENQTEDLFEDFSSNDVVSAFINDDAIDIILEE